MTRQTYRQISDGLSVTRSGRASHDFRVQRLFLTDLYDASVTVREKPLILQTKTACQHLVAFRQLMKHPRECGHTGLVLEFHRYDRAVKSSMEKPLRKFACMYQDRQMETTESGVWFRRSFTQWLEVAGCFAHDLNGALKWALLQLMQDRLLLRSSFLVMESARNGYTILMRCLGPWLRSFLYIGAFCSRTRGVFVVRCRWRLA